MEDKPFIPARSFIHGGGTIMAEEKNPDFEETNVPWGLSLSLGKAPSSSSTSTDMSVAPLLQKKVELSTANFLEKIGNGAFMSGHQDFEETGVSLDLSLSLGNTSSSSSTPIFETVNFIDKIGNGDFLSGPSTFEVCYLMCMEKNGDGLQSDQTKTNDVSLDLSLSMNKSWRFEVGESSNHRNAKNSRSLDKGKTMLNPKPPAYKRRKVEMDDELRMTELRLGRDPWCIKKKLYNSDLGNMARLMLGSELVEYHILPHWNADQVASIERGLPVSVWDSDTNTLHGMIFKRWSSKANVFISNWTKDFVKRRGLKQDDEIGLYWDVDSSRFNFSVLNRAPLQ